MTNDLMNDNACNHMLSEGDAPSMPLVVLKLGGSLLKCTDLADRMRSLIATLRPQRILIVVGGGDAADVVRDWSDRFSLSEEMAHWLAIRSLSLTRGLVKELLPECEEVETPSAAAEVWIDQQRPVLLKLESYLRQAEVNEPSPLPHTWDVTSDSIAAWVATQWGADQLILLKSIELPDGMDLQQAEATGLVDRYFPIIAQKVNQICWCHLLTDRVNVLDWQTHTGQ
ncbi:MAG: hypothetical protein WCJ09_14315 [Planctomycetota bacterium]